MGNTVHGDRLCFMVTFCSEPWTDRCKMLSSGSRFGVAWKITRQLSRTCDTKTDHLCRNNLSHIDPQKSEVPLCIVTVASKRERVRVRRRRRQWLIDKGWESIISTILSAKPVIDYLFKNTIKPCISILLYNSIIDLHVTA